MLATVQELKDVLEREQSKAMELSEKALGAVDTLLNLSTWVLGVLAFVVGIIAIFGYALISNAAKKSAKEVAKSGLEAYLRSQDFAESLEVAIRQEVKDRLKDKVIMNFMTEEKDTTGDGDAFPVADGKAK